MNRTAMMLAILSAFLVSCETANGPASHSRIATTNSSPNSNTAIASLIAAGPSNTELSRAEKELYQLIMEYRTSNGLPKIPVSKSLSYVAKLHVRDLETHTYRAPYNFHSWSIDGPWQSVDYAPDHRDAKLMWDKPRELTRYTGNGYEIVYMHSDGATPRDALSQWKLSRLHNAVIINEDDWRRRRWEAIGIGIFGQYAVVWFGEDSDPETT